MPASPVPRDTAAPNPRLRQVGRFALKRLLGKSALSMVWLVTDTRDGAELALVLPRTQPADARAERAWDTAVRRAARLNHPNLAPVVEVGRHDRWPYLAYEMGDAVILRDHLGGKALLARDAASLVNQALRGLAFAHEAGVAHCDLQAHMMLVTSAGVLRVIGLEAAAPIQAHSLDAAALRAQRDAAQSDVLAMGVLLHQLLSGQVVLDEPDVGQVIVRLPPSGRDIVRLPWGTAQPIPEPLRAIANRATDRQERQRYRNARTLIRALEGWLSAEAAGGDGPLALLLERMRNVGVFPAMPGAAGRAARLALMERERTNELAEVVLEDMALTFEMLRHVNSAQVRGIQVAGNGPVLTMRRAIAMLGLDGVRRAANGLRAWPGPLQEASALALEQLVARVKHAAQLAQALRPAGYDAEVVNLVTVLQNLGRLVVHYHFADEAQQIIRLMQTAAAQAPGQAEEPGMSEEGASFAVLGVDIETIGVAVARQWGLDESVLLMTRRLPPAGPVRAPESDDDTLRALASCANECVEALGQPAARVAAALARVAQRHGRNLKLSLRDLQDALHLAPAKAERGARAGTVAATPLAQP